jgi:hypothetical protein
MWGNGAVFFHNTELKAVTSNGYYTQIRNGQGQNGNVYVDCRLTSAPGVSGMYLGRIDPTVFPYSQVVYINSTMGPHIAPVGWLLNNASTAPNAQFWEFGSVDTNGAPIDVSQRLSASRQITAVEAAQWSDPAYVLNGWVPVTVSATAARVAAGSPITVHWTAAPGHSANDSIALFAVAAPGAVPIVTRNVGSETHGRITFSAPTLPGAYEVRYVLSDGAVKATGSRIVVNSR